MSRASEHAISLFRQERGPLRCLAACDPCARDAGRLPPAPQGALRQPVGVRTEPGTA